MITLRIEKSSTTNFYYITCDEYKGFLVAEDGFEKTLAQVSGAFKELLEAGAKIQQLIDWRVMSLSLDEKSEEVF
jgi:hypothetical protein